LRQPACSRTG